jgi:glycosyltransferase involved in cell wall biosynthesis
MKRLRVLRDYLVADYAAALADSIDDLLSNERDRLALGARGRSFVEQHYSWPQSLAVLDELITHVTFSGTA